MRFFALLALALTLTTNAFADSDVEKGKAIVHKKCKICHSIINGDEVILKGQTVGPNLYGVFGRQAGVYPDFDYSDSIVEAGEQGLVWSAETLDGFLIQTRDYMRARLNDDKARSRMSYFIKNPDDRRVIAAYLATLSE
ncbi:MAG: c-type cytochrome [Pikeienuella sp.]